MKYVTMKVLRNGAKDLDAMYFPIIVPNTLSHDVVAKHAIAMLEETYEDSTVTAVSAGMLNSADPSKAYGKSPTLKLESHPDDTNLITGSDYGSSLHYRDRRPQKRVVRLSQTFKEAHTRSEFVITMTDAGVWSCPELFNQGRMPNFLHQFAWNGKTKTAEMFVPADDLYPAVVESFLRRCAKRFAVIRPSAPTLTLVGKL